MKVVLPAPMPLWTEDDVLVPAFAQTAGGPFIPITLDGREHPGATLKDADGVLYECGSSEVSVEASPTLRSLGLSGRACAPLERLGVTTIHALAMQDRSAVAETRGVSRESIKNMDELLAAHGLAWGGHEVPAAGIKIDDEEDADDEAEDIL